MKNTFGADPYLQILEYEIPLSGLKRECAVLVVSDLHLAVSEPDSDPAYREHVAGLKRAWEPVKREFAELSGESLSMEHLLEPEDGLFHYIEYANRTATPLIFTGDMLDEYSEENLRLFARALAGLKTPYLWVRGNHECGDGGALLPYMQNGAPVQRLTVGGVNFVGLDNSAMRVTDEQTEAVFSAGSLQPSVLVMHAPVLTEYNREKIGSLGEYFLLGAKADAATDRFIGRLLRENVFSAILCGHAHRRHVSGFCENCLQICTPSAMVGACSLVRFVPGEPVEP